MMQVRKLEDDCIISVGDELIHMDDIIDTLFVIRSCNIHSEFLESMLHGLVSNEIIAKDNKLLIEYNKDNIDDIREIIMFNIKLNELYAITTSFETNSETLNSI